ASFVHLGMKRILLALAILILPACAPLSVTFTLGAKDRELQESVVLQDTAGAGNAKIALIDVRGLIVDEVRSGILTQGTNPVDDPVARLRKAEDDSAVKAIVIRINSPGGSVTASDTMYREVRRFAAVTGKPVIASMGEVAASGGYYLALAADEIMAQPTTI